MTTYVKEIPEHYRVDCGRCGRTKDMRCWCVCVPQEEIDEFNRKLLENDWTERVSDAELSGSETGPSSKVG